MPSPDDQRRDALCALLQQPDAFDLKPRRHRTTQTGKRSAQADWHRRLPNVYTAHKLTDREQGLESR